MVASNVKQVLDDEGKMLGQLAPGVSGFAVSPTGDAEADGLNSDNLKSWEQDLSGYRDVNTKLASLDKDAFNEAMKAEIDLLEGLSKYISGTSAAAEYWRGKFSRHIELSKRLLKLNQ
jgi:hypothetical protein